MSGSFPQVWRGTCCQRNWDASLWYCQRWSSESLVKSSSIFQTRGLECWGETRKWFLGLLGPGYYRTARVSQEEMWPSLRDKDWAFRFTFPSTKGLFWVVFLWVSALEWWQAIIVTGSGRSYSQCPAWLCSISSQRNCSCLGPGKKAQTTSQRDWKCCTTVFRASLLWGCSSSTMSTRDTCSLSLRPPFTPRATRSQNLRDLVHRLSSLSTHTWPRISPTLGILSTHLTSLLIRLSTPQAVSWGCQNSVTAWCTWALNNRNVFCYSSVGPKPKMEAWSGVASSEG